MIDLGSALLDLVESCPDIVRLDSIAVLRRFIKEQAYFDYGKKTWITKDNKDIAANSLQSAHDPDVTYRKKSGKWNVGLVTNISETCADENPVQFVIDYTVEKNVKSDTAMLEERLPAIKERTDLTDLNIDGGYFDGGAEELSRNLGVAIHYTNMTGSEPDPDKIPVTSFVIKDHKK